MDIFYGAFDIAVLNIPGAVLCCIGLLCIASVMPNSKILTYIGKNTLVIFALHQMLFKQIFVNVLGFHSRLLLLVGAVLSVIFCLLIDYCISKTPLKIALGKR